MKCGLLIIIMLSSLLFSCNRFLDDCICEHPLFDVGCGSFAKTEGSVRKVTGFSVNVYTGCSAELSDIVIKITVPKEVILKRKFRQEPNEIVDDKKGVIIANFDNLSPGNSVATSTAVMYDKKEWSKPIEVLVTANFNPKFICPNIAMREGRYNKRSLYTLNERGFLDKEASSDEYWNYGEP